MTRLKGVVCGLFMAAACVTGCGRSGERITVAGSTAFQPFAEKLAEQFMTGHPGFSVTVQGGGSAMGIQSALSGTAQIGMADMVDLPPEANALARVIVARDSIAIVVNPGNPVAELTTAQIHDIFGGSIRNWNEVGGEDGPITVVSREAGSGTRTSFEQIVKNVSLTRDAIVQDSNGTIRETVANDANAIGYLSHGLINEKVKAVLVDGAACTTEEIVAGRYKLVRPIFLLTRGAPAGSAKALIDYILSAEGQKTIRDNGLIPAL